jgi:hypothetical protein
MLVTLHRLFAGYTTQRNFVCDFVLNVLRGIFQPKRKYEDEKQFT